MLENPLNKKTNALIQNIRHVRTQQGITQYEMSCRLCISQNAYFKIEKGITKLDIYRLLQISDILQHDFSEYLRMNFNEEHS